jgi:hypothetical protein
MFYYEIDNYEITLRILSIKDWYIFKIVKDYSFIPAIDEVHNEV